MSTSAIEAAAACAGVERPASRATAAADRTPAPETARKLRRGLIRLCMESSDPRDEVDDDCTRSTDEGARWMWIDLRSGFNRTGQDHGTRRRARGRTSRGFDGDR